MRISLLAKQILVLAATGLLPLTISFYQLRVNKDALLAQLQITHSVAARTTSERVTAFLAPLQSFARTFGETAFRQGALSQVTQELLSGVLQDNNVGVKIFRDDGEELLRAQQGGIWEDIDPSHDADAPGVSFVQGGTKRWLRLVEPLPEDSGQVVLLAAVSDLEGKIMALEVDGEADLILAQDDGTVILGSVSDLTSFPSESVDLALSGKFRSGSEKYEGSEFKEDLVVAYARVDKTPWVVLSRQNAHAAEVAQDKIQKATGFAALAALGLTSLLSWLAFITVIRPLRRVIRAQEGLVGSVRDAGASEIAQIEAAFEILEKRVRDQEDLGKIFLGRYQVVEVVGEGAMGTVFKGWDPKLERPLALKTIRLETEDLKREKLVDTLLREAKTSAGFNHPNIVTVYDAADQGKAAFIAMELIDGISLEELIESLGRLEWRQMIPIAAAVARGLAAAHARQLVHQDVKPANILLGRDSSIKVTDFGISQAITSASVSGDVICGTPGFIAPECLEGAGYTVRSDLFALGVLIYEGLCGRHPFAGKTLRITILNTLNQNPPPPDLDSDMPEELTRLLFELLDKNPDRRPENAESVVDTLEQLARRHDLSWTYDVREAQETRASASSISTRQGSKAIIRTQLFSTRLVVRETRNSET